MFKIYKHVNIKSKMECHKKKLFFKRESEKGNSGSNGKKEKQ